MNAYLHCISHSPLMGYVDPSPAVLAEVEKTIADARKRIEAFNPELVILFAPDHYNGFFLRHNATFLHWYGSNGDW